MTYIPAEIRKLVFVRAGNCCEYCLMGREDRLIPYQIDHIISIKHGGTNDDDNLCLACYKCNGFKGSDIASRDPETGDPVFLFHPRKQHWENHFRLDGAEIEPLTPEGRITVFLLRLNSTDRIKQRSALIKVGRYPCKTEE